MNKIEKKLYQLVNILSEAEGEIVKNKKTGNVYIVKSFDPGKHDKPTPDEVEKTKAANGGKIPKLDKPEKKPEPKAAAVPQPKKAEPKKIAASDFKSDAEKSADDAKLKNQMPKDEKPKFNPIPASDVKKEIPKADPETFDKPSGIPDEIGSDKLDKFVTDIAKVGQEIADKKARGEETKKINLCKVTVPGTNLYCEKNKGLTRVEMPQFKGAPTPGSPASKMPLNKDGEVDTEPLFRKMLKDKGIETTQTEVAADRLKATQSELGADKVLGMVEGLEKDPNHPALTGPIFVSRDGYVIDGHHRWAAIAAYNAKNPKKQIPMKCEVIDKGIDEAIPMCNKFASDMGIASKAQGVTTGKAPEQKPIGEKKNLSLANLLKARN
jgi:hypothetical protein